MMKTTKMMTLVGVALGLTGPNSLDGQAVVASGQACESGVVEGHLGISGLDCVGDCEITLARSGKEERWSFSTEPKVFSIEDGGPADGILRAGDYLVAIDGILITTRRGGLRWANLEPGEVVTVRYRREGRVQEAGIRVGSRCAREPVTAVGVGRVTIPEPDLPPEPTPPLRPDETRVAVGIATAPRVRVAEPVPAADAAVASYETAVASYRTAVGLATSGVLATSPLLDSSFTGRLGIGFSCSECGTSTNDSTGVTTWFFSSPVEVTKVNSGGPAQKAGIRLGDLIKTIGGHEISSEEGGEALSRLEVGVPVELTVVRRNGREENVTVVPVGREPRAISGAVAPVAEPDEPSPPSRVRVAPGAAAAPRAVGVARGVSTGRVSAAAPMADVVAGPDELPISFSGTVSGVEVVVRGGPVAVSELQGARTLIINADGLWVRIRVPAGTGRSGGGSLRR